MANPQADEAVFKIEIRNKRPVELADLSSSLNAIAQQYGRFVSQQEESYSRDEAKLYIKEIRAGSIVAELVGYAMNHGKDISDGIRAGVTVIGFAKQLRENLKSLKDGGKSAENIHSRDLKDLSKIIDVTAKDPGSVFHIEASHGGTVNVHLSLNSIEANAVQNQSARLLEAHKEPDQTVLSRVLMYWHTASLGATSSSANKAVIERITDRALPVVIDNDEWKQQMLAGKENPLLIGFLVDVEVLYIKGKPKIYRVIKLYEAVQDEPDE